MLIIAILVNLIFIVSVSASKQQMNSFKDEKPSSMCFNEIYKIPIMSTHLFRITLNRTLLIQRNVASIHISAKIDDRKVLQFENSSDQIMTKINLLYNHSRKF